MRDTGPAAVSTTAVRVAMRCKQQEEPNLGLALFAASREASAFPTFRAIHIRPRLFAAILWPGPVAGLQG